MLPDALVLVSRSVDPAFPSDHAVMAGAVAAGLFVAHRGLGAVAAVLAIAMAFTRVYVGAHFPLDVAAGLVIGAGIAWLSYSILASRLSRMVGILANTAVRPLLIAEEPIDDGLMEHLLSAPAWLVLLVVVALPALESSIFLGFAFPGEIAALLLESGTSAA